jgi:medium-chain acyl-[acyl-carrier-protein] hydrolase
MNVSTSTSRHVGIEHLGSDREASLSLFCLPYAGGSAQAYREWKRYFPSAIDLCLVHLPGRGKLLQEKPFTDMETLVQSLADRIEEEVRPLFAFYGHSMGALISFELARELFRRRRTLPKRLFLSGRRAPHLPSFRPTTFNLSHDEFVEEIKRLNGTPKEVLNDAEMREFLLPIMRADFRIVDSYKYRPGTRLPCPISVYGGTQDEDVPLEDLHAWQEQTSDACTVTMLPGDHFFIQKPEWKFLSVLRANVLAALHEPGK